MCLFLIHTQYNIKKSIPTREYQMLLLYFNIQYHIYNRTRNKNILIIQFQNNLQAKIDEHLGVYSGLLLYNGYYI